MLIFRSEEHVAVWCRTWNQPQGASFSLGQVWALAKAWYSEDRRKEDWQRKTKEAAQQVFDKIGLISPFWQL